LAVLTLPFVDIGYPSIFPLRIIFMSVGLFFICQTYLFPLIKKHKVETHNRLGTNE